jgi:rhodanese-related sulfurtransferase
LLVLALATAASAPAPDREVKIFGDWAVGCDNGASCEMTSLLPEGEEGNAAYQDIFVSVGRAPGAAGAITVLLELPNHNGKLLSLRIDAMASTIVVYDESDSLCAAESARNLREAGFERVAVLTGGREKWLSEQRPIDLDELAYRNGRSPLYSDYLEPRLA